MQIDADVCVIGGGPSGASAAIQLRNLGYRVCLIDRQGNNRPWSVEAFPETVLPLLGELGVRSVIERAGMVRCQHTHLRWRASEEQRPTSAFISDRGLFDGALLHAVRLAGVIVLAPAHCRRTNLARGYWTIAAEHDGRRTQVTARFLIEATGRGGDQARLGAMTAALCGRWRGLSHRGRMAMRIEALERGWLWAAPDSDGSWAVTCFLDASACRGLDHVLRLRLYREMLAPSSLAGMLGTGEIVDEIAVRDAACRQATDPIGSQSIKVGDRAFAMDPLSSQGTLTALQSGIQAGIVVNTILRGGDGDAAMTFYREVLTSARRRHRRTAAEIYASQTAFSTRFWRERSGEPAAKNAMSPGSPITPQASVRLSPEARLLELPAIDGKEIRRKLSLSHPRLERSVTWFSGVEVAPLLARLGSGRSIPALLADWSQTVPTDVAESLVEWLVGSGILVGDPAPRSQEGSAADVSTSMP